MAQIIQRRLTGELMGAGFGSGLNQALNALIDKKMKDIQQRHTAKNLERGFNISPEKAQAIAELDPAFGQILLQNSLNGPSQQIASNILSGSHQQPTAQGFLPAIQQDGAPSPQQISPQARFALGALQGQQVPEMIQGNVGLNNMIAAPQTEAFLNALQNYGLEGQQQQAQNNQQELGNQAQGAQVNLPEQKPMKRSEILTKQLNENLHRLTPAHAKQISDEIKKERESEEKKEIALQKHQEKEYGNILSENKNFYEEIRKKSRAAEYADNILNRMTKLIDKGNLPYAVLHSMSESLGNNLGKIIGGTAGGIAGAIGGLSAGPAGLIPGVTAGAGGGAYALKDIKADIASMWEHPDAQEFAKLTLEFMNKMKDVFGGRVTVQEMETFLKSIPNLSMTDEGKRAVIRNMKLTGQAWKVQNKIMNDIIKKNGGRQPRNLEALVEEMSAPILKKLSDKFINGTELYIDIHVPEKSA